MARTKKKTTRKSDLDRRWSILLFGIGAFVVLLSFIPGEAGWAWIRTNILFGTFGVSGWFLGPLVIFWAVLMSLGRAVLDWVIRGVIFLLALSGVALVFGGVDFTNLSFISILQTLHLEGTSGGFSGGLISFVFGWTLLTAFGRTAARVFTILILIVAIMLLTKITPADIGRFVIGVVDRIRDAGADRREERRLRREQEAYYEDEEYYEEEYDPPPPQPLRPRSRAVDIALGPAAAASEPAVAPKQGGPFTAAAATSGEVDIGPGGTFGLNPLAEGELFAAAAAEPAATATSPGSAGQDESWLQTGAADDPLEPFPISRPAARPFAMEEEPLRPFDPTSDESLFDDEAAGNFLLFGEDDPYAPLGGAQSRLPRGTLVDVEYVPTEAGAAPAPAPEFDLFGRSVAPEPVQFPFHKPSEQHFASNMESSAGQTARLPDEPDPAAPGFAGDPKIAPLPDAPGVPSSAAAVTSAAAGAPAGAGMFAADAAPFDVSPAAGAAVAAAGAALGTVAGVAAGFEGDEEVPSVDALIDKAAAPKASAERVAAEPDEGTPRPYEYPPLNLFAAAPAENNAGAREEMKKTADLLVSTLESFGVQTRILDVCRGPSVTRYEIQPQAGVKISRITNLADDIALNLAAAGVRIEAPIPGKPAVGIEVPNRHKTTVSIRGILESRAFTEAKSPLAIALGKDIAGESIIADLTKMPHLLIAGSTGSGKSVCINATIMSMLYRASPEEVQMILIDPKYVELAEYNGIPHLMMPVVTEPKKAAQALGNAVNKMEQRYQLFAQHGVRDITSFNKLAARSLDMEKLPYIAIIIDELADLMMVAGKDVENYICRLAQKARAAGMHLIVATQRPSVDVITGLIKANIPSRIAFAVSSQVDSRTILDGGGAEKLLGMGDMLYMPIGASKPVRVQGTFVQDKEISAVLRYIKQTSAPQYDEAFIEEMQQIALSGSAGASNDEPGEADGDLLKDPAFQSAVEMALENGQISTSHIQRRLRLGYARAGRIVDGMEQLHIVGEPNGSKPRELLITRQQWLEMQMNAQD